MATPGQSAFGLYFKARCEPEPRLAEPEAYPAEHCGGDDPRGMLGLLSVHHLAAG